MIICSSHRKSSSWWNHLVRWNLTLFVLLHNPCCLGLDLTGSLNQAAKLEVRTRSSYPKISIRGGSYQSTERPKPWETPIKDGSQVGKQRTITRLRSALSVNTPIPQGNLQKNALLVSGTVVALLLLFMMRRSLSPYLSTRSLQERTIALLQNLQPEDPRDTWKALSMYACGMAAWELLGLSTIPVETAAAMVFGWSAFPASAIGKLAGALVAYGLGRTVLSNWARRKLAGNTVFQLLQQTGNDVKAVKSKRHYATKRPCKSDKLDFLRTPMATAFLMKYSCFPEFVKNFGSSLLQPVTVDKFILVTIVHGWSFTALWTLLGVDSGARLQATNLGLDMPPRNMALLISLGLSFFIGIVLSPALMAWWIRDLKVRSRPTVAKRT